MGTLISHTMATFSAAKTTQLTQFSKAAGQFKNKTVAKASFSNTIEAKGKTCKVAINGFGRIGRNFLRCWHGRGKDTLLEVVAINDSGGVKQASHLVKYDSVLGTFEADVKIIDDTHISIDGKSIEIVSSRDPLQLPWKALGVDIVIEGTGVFIGTPGASKHLTAGAKKVVITAPAKGDDIPTYVLGVNADQYKNSDKIISNASCTTNGLAPFVKVLNDKFGLVKGLMTTTHSYTGDQRILDASHRARRRAQHRAHRHRRRQGGRARAPPAQGQAQRHRAPRPHPQRVRRRHVHPGGEEVHRRGHQRRVPRGGGGSHEGHPRRVRRAPRVHRLPLL